MEDNKGSILLIFQAPGINEWTNGRPVSSPESRSAGMRLEAAFAHCGTTRASYNITNAVQCFPGKQENPRGGKCARDKAPLAAARRHCADWLREDLNAHRYKRVVVFGSLARKTVKELDCVEKTRFIFKKHPSGGLSNDDLYEALY
jgi:uracil-DNA glycosylase family 4